MMEEQSNQFAAKESAPIKGYLKVETGNNKGAIRCAVQNLRYFEKSDYIYKLILFGKKGERTIHTIIGNLLINRMGNGETYFRFQPLDIDGKGNPYHYYSTAIIAAASTKNEKEPLHPVLKGVTFSEGEPFQSELTPIEQWEEKGKSKEMDDLIGKIDRIIEEVQEALERDSSPESVMRAEEKLEQVLKGKIPADDEYETAAATDEIPAVLPEIIKPTLETEQAAGIKPTLETEPVAGIKQMQERAQGVRIMPVREREQTAGIIPTADIEPVQPKECAGSLEPESVDEKKSAAGEFEAAPSHDQLSKKTYNNYYNEYVLNACAHTCRMAEYYEDVTPFDRDKTGARWKKIVNITNLPLVSPGAHYFATQYHHYLFGAKADEKGMATRFYFGIPGRFLDEEQPDGGKSGFTYWQPIRGAAPVFEGYHKGERASRNIYGYWIVAVNAKTGYIEEV